MATAYITHPECLRHETGDYHPEAPSRLHAIEDQLVASGLMDLLRYYQAPAASREQLLRVHTEAYLAKLDAIRPDGRLLALDPDTAMGDHTLTAAYHAAGAVVFAVERVMAGEVENAFCAVRPPGHHAEPARAMGFCIFNNVAVGTAHALAACGLERVAIVDFDVHHGNGTETMFRDDERVLFCSAYQDPFYPWTETADDRPNLIHTRLPAGTASDAFREAITNQWLPALDDFRPQMILISAGFDGHWQDDLSQLMLEDADFGWITERVLEVARRHAEGRVVSVLEGGYNLKALALSVALHVRALMGINK